MTVLSSANWNVLLPRVARTMRGYTSSQPKFAAPPFGQYRMMLADPDSDLRRSHSDYYIFAERFEDFAPPFQTIDSVLAGEAAERFRDYLGAIREARTTLDGCFLIHDLCLVRPFLATLNELTERTEGISSLLHMLNKELATLASDLPDTIIIPISFVIGEIGRRAADPGKYWLAGRAPFSSAFADTYGKLLSGVLLARQGRTVRALAVDLDNTLWGGVVGDDHLAALQCGSDFPDNRFLALQEFLLALKRRGIVLTLVSKNTEAIAFEAIDSHSGMALKRSDFAASRVRWDPKFQGIREIAEELGLAESAFLFLDDSPVERDEVRRNVPLAMTPELPLDVADWPAALCAQPFLTAIDMTGEDLGRARSYEIRRQIVAQKSVGTREEFLNSLEMTLSVESMRQAAMRRVVQLFAKTNQFNTTGRRYNEAELQQIQRNGNDLLSVRLTDRYGSDEIVAAVCVSYDAEASRASIDCLVMSCRVMGRGVETGILSAVTKRAAARGMTIVLGEIVLLPRNEPCRQLFSQHGFRDLGNGQFGFEPGCGEIPWPSWFRRNTE